MDSCKFELKSSKECGKEMYILYKRKFYCKTHFNKINDNTCKYKKKDNTDCDKKAGYTKDGRIFYCKTHFDKLEVDRLKNLLPNCSQCNKKGIYTKDNINYCKNHYDKLNEIKCKGKLLNGTNCTKKASYIKDGIDYCKTHYDKSNEHICDNISSKGVKCTKKGFGQIDNKYYCTTHLVNHTIDKAAKPIESTILDEINNIKKINLTKSNKTKVKKDIFKILLKVHPDKCTIPNFDSEKYTKDLNNILERIKVM